MCTAGVYVTHSRHGLWSPSLQTRGTGTCTVFWPNSPPVSSHGLPTNPPHSGVSEIPSFSVYIIVVVAVVSC